MRYLESYKIFEAYKPLIEIKLKDGNILRYKDEWKTSRSKERHDITKYLMDIFAELIDDGYVVNDGGWISKDHVLSAEHFGYPYIWISSRRRRGGMDWDFVDESVGRAVDYLESIGFITKIEKLGSNQMYLYFDKDPKSIDEIKESVSVSEVAGHVDSMLYDMEDLGYAYSIYPSVKRMSPSNGFINSIINVVIFRKNESTILLEDIDYRINQIRDIIKYKVGEVGIMYELFNTTPYSDYHRASTTSRNIIYQDLDKFSIKDELDTNKLNSVKFTVLEYGMNEWLDEFSYTGKDGNDYRFKSEMQFDDLELFIDGDDLQTDVRPVIKEIKIEFVNEVPEKI